MEEASSNKDQCSFKREPPSSGDQEVYSMEVARNQMPTMFWTLFSTNL